MNPTFSIIIPVYNVASYLHECLDSVLAAARTLSEKCVMINEICGGIEIICVDDGSTDGSGEILDEYAEKVRVESSSSREDGKDPFLNLNYPLELKQIQGRGAQFRVLHQSNAGVSAARNAALEMATGEWILFLDADDVVNPMLIETLHGIIASHSTVDLVSFDGLSFPIDGHAEWSRTSSEEQTRIVACRDKLIDRLCSKGFWSFAYKAPIVKGIRFPPYALGEDHVFLVQTLLASVAIAETPAVLHGYRTRPGSAYLSKITYPRLLNMIDWRKDIVSLLTSSRKQIDRLFVQRFSFDVVRLWYHTQRYVSLKESTQAWIRRQSALISFLAMRRLPLTTRVGIAGCLLMPIKFVELHVTSCCDKILKRCQKFERGCSHA